MADADALFVWQDREIRFDSHPALLECRKGEVIIDSMNSVEDTKGNNGERGSLVVTNLRLLWISHRSNFVNLSIGYNAFLSVATKQAHSKLRGSTLALCILAKGKSRFEFVFTSLVKNSPRLFSTVQAVSRAYDTSKLYRDIKLRGSVIKDSQLIMLPDEHVFTHVTGVWNLSSDQGNLGALFITNVRVVWHASLAQNFNVSIPYMQMRNVRVRNSKFGLALVVEAYARSGGYILGFRIDSDTELRQLYEEIDRLRDVFTEKPIFGVNFETEDVPVPAPVVQTREVEEDAEIIGADDDALAAQHYFASEGADGHGDFAGEIGFDPQLGLAVEPPQPGLTLEQLWRVVTI